MRSPKLPEFRRRKFDGLWHTYYGRYDKYGTKAAELPATFRMAFSSKLARAWRRQIPVVESAPC
jgi:hypothetical protein